MAIGINLDDTTNYYKEETNSSGLTKRQRTILRNRIEKNRLIFRNRYDKRRYNLLEKTIKEILK